MKRLFVCLVVASALVACGGTDAATRSTNLGAAPQSAAPSAARAATATATPRPGNEQPHQTSTPTVNTANAPGTFGTQRFTADQVIAALQAAGLSIGDVQAAPRDPNALAPDVAQETKTFSIASIAPRGGQLYIFTNAQDLQTMQAWFARLPDLAPYVYTNGTVLLQLHRSLPQAEAERFKAALATLR